MAARGQGLFSLYSYIKHVKNLLVRNHWTDFNITWQKCSLGDPLSRFSLSQHDALKKQGHWGGQGYKIYTKILEQWAWLKLQKYANLFAQMSDIGPSWSSCMTLYQD